MARKKTAKKAAKKAARKTAKKSAKKAPSARKPLGGTLTMVTLHVHDLERALGFYRDTLGFPTVDDVIDTPDFGWAELRVAPGVKLGLHADKKGMEKGARPPGGTSGFYFVVPNVDAVIEKLRAKGVKIADEPEDASFGRVASVEDPDANEIAILSVPRR